MFYSEISKFYDYIFPLNPIQLSFINSVKKIKEKDYILDIGCATGNLTSLLATQSNNVIGLDLDLDLLSEARKKFKSKVTSFQHGNMLTLADDFNNDTIDRVVSFGNTLVHLPDRESVQFYFNTIHSLLKKDGLFIVQIINYDRIINDNITKLSTIENEYVKFERDYVLHKNNLDFKTTLTIKSNGQIVSNNIPLLTLSKKEIKFFLENSGFKLIRFYGNFNGDKLDSSSIPLIFSCQK